MVSFPEEKSNVWEEFITHHLELGYWNEYLTKHKPCDFLQEDGSCKLGDCKPDS